MEYTLIEPAARADRRTPLAVSAYYFFSLAGFAIATPYLPLYWKSLHYVGPALGALLTAQGLGGLLAQGPIGYLSDRGGHRRGLVLGLMGLCGLTLLVYPLYQSVALLLVATLIQSATFRSSDAIVQALVGDWAERTAMASTYGRLRMYGSIGWVLSLLLTANVSFMTNPQPFRAARWTGPMFACMGALHLLAAASILLAKPAPARRRLRMGPWAALTAVVKTPQMGRFLMAFTLYWTALQSIGLFLSLFMNQMGATHRTISMAFAVSAISETPFIFLAGRLADRWGEKRLLMLAFSMLPVRLVLAALAPSPMWLVATQAMHSVTYGVTLVGAVTYMNHRLPTTLRASGQGALGVVMSISATAAPFIGAFVAHWAGYRGTYAVMTLVAIAAWVVLYAMPEGIIEPTNGN